MKAEIISIGTEILLGNITDTNSSYLAEQLPLLGIDLLWVTQVGDNRNRIAELLRHAWERSDLTIITGGLGPTEDDLTRESIAEMLGEEISIDADLERWLRDLFRRIGRSMPERNLKQATLIPSAETIPNPKGTAPGWWVKRDGRMIIAMPGPPWEMQRMWKTEVRDKLRRTTGDIIITSKTLKTLGLTEAKLDELVSPLLSSVNPTIGVYAKPTGIELRLTAKASGKDETDQMLSYMESQVRAIIGRNIWGTDEDILEGVVGDMLRERDMTVSVLESCTGGLVANLLTDTPGSSAYFKGGAVVYSNEMKIAFGVDPALISEHGVVSAQVAEAMSTAARRFFGTEIGLGITGIAGPDSLEGKPVGTVYTAIADGTNTRSFHAVYPQHRLAIKRHAASGALIEIRRMLLGYD